MAAGEARTEIILRRRKREYVYHSRSRREYNILEDIKSEGSGLKVVLQDRPQNRRFELLDDREMQQGSLTLHTCTMFSDYLASTPWGELKLHKTGMTQWELSRGGSPIATIKEGLINKLTISYAIYPEIQFKRNLDGSKLTAVREDGGIAAERSISQSPRDPARKGSIKLSGREFKRLTDEEKSETEDGDLCMDWRIVVTGFMPIPDPDIIAALTMFLARWTLERELATAQGGVPG